MSLSSPGRKSTPKADIHVCSQVKEGGAYQVPLSSIQSFSHKTDLLAHGAHHD